MTSQIIRTVGVLRAFLAVVGLGFLFKNLAEHGWNLPVDVYAVQAVLAVTTIAGGIGWALLQDWGRKVLLIPSLFTLAQAFGLFLRGPLPPWSMSLATLLVFSVLSSVTLVLIFLPAARCEAKWDRNTDETAFRSIGAFQILAALVLGGSIAVQSYSALRLALAVFTAPTVLLALGGGLGMLFLKRSGRIALMILWSVHAVIAGLGPPFGSFFYEDFWYGNFWKILLTDAVSCAFGSPEASHATANLVFLGVLSLFVLAWLPSSDVKKI